MKNYTFHFFLFSLCCFVFFSLFSISAVSANNYQKIAPGSTVTLGEFVFDDNFVSTTTDCWIGVTDPTNTEIVASTTLMTANDDGWHYYDYTTAGNAPSGIWPSVMICGTVQRGDLVIVDKSFIVDWSVVSTSTIKEVIDTSLTVATSSLSAVISAHIDTVSETASSSIVSRILSSIAEIPANVWSATGRTLSNFGTLVADVWTNTTRTLTGAGLDSGTLATLSDIQTATSSVAAVVDANTNSTVLAASTSLATSIPINVWNATTRSLTSFGTLVADVWTNTIRTLTGAGLDSGSLATLSDITTATSSLVAVINTNTDAQLLAASTSLANFINTNSNTTILAASTSLASYLSAYTNAASSSIAAFVNANTNNTVLAASTSLAAFINAYIDTATSTLTSEIQNSWTVTLSDFGETTVSTAYKAKLQVLNYATVPTDADSLPTVVITDPVGTVQVPAGVMTKDSNGTYSYSYSIGGSAVGGVWETVVSVVVNSQTVKVNDYWNLSSSPADVNITEITDKVIPTITANVRIDNMGTSASDFYYVYCIVSNEANLCGGNDDIDSGSDTAYINAGSFINLSLTLDEVPTAGTYWFKVKARALAETNWAASTEQFVAESGTVTPPPASGGAGGGGAGGGGGGASGGGVAAVIIPTTTAGSLKRSDFNGDNKVNSIDFSILLAFWQKTAPFKNPKVDINKDNKVNSVDFSILLYEWDKK